MPDTVTLPAPDISLPPERDPIQEKFQRERRAFLRLLPGLLQTHRGQYVAIHEEQVVDCGDEKLPLILRQYERFGYVPILVTLVAEQPETWRVPYRREVQYRSSPYYAFNKQIHPPAPFVHVTLRRIDGSNEVVNVPAQIDTAAARTIFPSALVEQMALVPADSVLLEGFGGTIVRTDTHAVVLQIRDLPRHTVEVASHPKEPHILLGRDILNHHRLILDGPQLSLKIE